MSSSLTFVSILSYAHNLFFVLRSSKDTTIRVWSRHTLLPHRTLRGHEGPVNAVGMDSSIYGLGSSKVVSASGDGKMILWDVASGERLRTFEGHDRGLACIEYSVSYLFCAMSYPHISADSTKF